MDLQLADQAAVVTGASRGIGRAIAVELAREGARLLLVSRSEAGLTETAQLCDGRATFLCADVTEPDAARRIHAVAEERLGQVEVLVNNAGISADLPLPTITPDQFQAQFDIHVLAPLRLMQAFAPGMAARGYGRIVNVGSIAGRRPTQTNIAYSAAKAAELSLTKAFADYYAPHGVCVNAVNPGAVEGPMWLDPGGLADQIAANKGLDREAVLASARTVAPRGQFAVPEEIAPIVAVLCSPLAANVVGAGWQVDGGSIQSI